MGEKVLAQSNKACGRNRAPFQICVFVSEYDRRSARESILKPGGRMGLMACRIIYFAKHRGLMLFQ